MGRNKRPLKKGGVATPDGQALSRTAYGVFIIESFEEGPARNGMLDGQALSRMLKVCLVPHRYHFVRTTAGLKRAIEEFRKSNFSFLHLSCHGTKRFFRLQGGKISFAQLEALVGPVLRDRRLFLSVCQGGRLELAQRFIPRYGCHSIVGMPNDLGMDDAAVFWSTFYYLMNRETDGGQIRKDMVPTLRRMSRFFKLELNYFSLCARRAPESRHHLSEFRFSRGGSQRRALRRVGAAYAVPA